LHADRAFRAALVWATALGVASLLCLQGREVVRAASPGGLLPFALNGVAALGFLAVALLARFQGRELRTSLLFTFSRCRPASPAGRSWAPPRSPPTTC
jgi:hypothetical protein